MLTADDLRKISEESKRKMKNIQSKEQAEEMNKKRLDVLKEVQERITEAENRLSELAKKGKCSMKVCVFRRGIHFGKKFDSGQDPKFLGMIGKTIYDHFSSRGFEVSFEKWIGGVRGEFDSDYGYDVVVSW